MNEQFVIAAVTIMTALLCAHAFCSEDVPLPVEQRLWNESVFQVPGLSDKEAVTFAIVEDPEKGRCLAVGPWRDGRHMARFQFSDTLPLTTGTIRGAYRTEGLGLYGGAVSIIYLKAGERMAERDFWLGPAAEWTPFEFVFRAPPPGADAISPGLGLAGKTEGKILFTDLAVSPEGPALSFPEDPGEVTRAAAPTDFEQGKFFRLEERDGTWWLVTPEGRGFYSVGTDGPHLPDEQEKGKEYASFLRSVGFNSLAGWTDIRGWGAVNHALMAEGERPFAAFACLGSGSWHNQFDQLLDARGKNTGEGHAFPDPFDPRFEEAYRARARRVAEVVRGKPWFVGYFADNEASHKDLFRHVYSQHCAAAFRRFLEERYGDIRSLNSAWGTDFTSFANLIERKPDPIVRKGPMYEDFHLFEREIVKRYVEITLRAIRAEDPEHLVFSNRFMLDDVERWPLLLDLYKPYDAIACNIYPSNQSAGLNDHEKSVYRMIHEKTGKPVIVGEWSVPAVDSGLYENPEMLDWSWNEVVETQTQRARQAACIAIDFYNMPFVVGAHWFIWRDIDSDKRQANRGLFAADGKPWREVIDALTNAHRKMGLPVPYE